MSALPVLVQTWLDPPLLSDFQVGQAVTWHASFIDRIARTLTDPDIVTFSYANPPFANTPTVYTYPASPIIKDAVGQYHMDLGLNTTGRWVLNIGAESTQFVGANLGNATIEVQVYGSGL